VLLEIALNAGSVVLEGTVVVATGRCPPRRAFGLDNARHVGPFYGASVIAVVCK